MIGSSAGFVEAARATTRITMLDELEMRKLDSADFPYRVAYRNPHSIMLATGGVQVINILKYALISLLTSYSALE